MIQPFKVECFSTKMLKFQRYDVIIYDVSADFRILFGMWNSFVMSYPCAKFQHEMTINNRINCIFSVFCFVYFWTNDRSLSIMSSLSMTSLVLCQFFLIFKVNALTVYCCAKFRYDWLLNNKVRRGRMPPT